MHFRVHLLSGLFVLASLIGCGGQSPPNQVFFKKAGDVAPPAKEAGGGGQAPAGNADIKAAPPERKIIFTGTLILVVENLDEAVPKVEKLVAAQKGYISRSEVSEDPGQQRTATFTLRIPAESFQTTRDGLLPLGTPERNAVDSQDVTEEFVDVQVRIKNLKEQEDKLNELLKEKRKEEKLEDIIKVSDRIAEVRRDVERVQGRLNVLANLTSLATINLTLREIKNYKPPTAPTFGSRISTTFGNSWEALVQFGQGAVLFAVGLTPWLIILVPLGLVIYAVRRWSRQAARPTPPAHPSPEAPR